MSMLNEVLARERIRDRERRVVERQHRRALNRLAAARRLQRRAESASRRARVLLLSV